MDAKNNHPAGSFKIGVAFLVKVIAAFSYGYVYAHFLPVSDSWTLFNTSLREYDTLLHNPSAFFSMDLSLSDPTELFSNDSDAGWNNTDDNLFIKILALLNLLSGGNYYLTALLFSFFSFWGLYQVFTVCTRHYPGTATPAFLLLFFIPSGLFWNSGLHKDGLIVFFTGMAIAAADKLLRREKAAMSAAIMLGSLCLLFLFRSVNALLLVPAIAAWILAIRTRVHTPAAFTITYLAAIGCFFLTHYLPDAYNLPLKLTEKQHDFLTLAGNSRLPLTPLTPDLTGYLRVLPQALNHVFLRPYFTEIAGSLQWMAFIENSSILLLAGWAFVRHRHNLGRTIYSAFPMFLLCLSLSMLVTIGLTVPFTGAIVRYKALYIQLLLVSCIIPIRNK